MGRADVENLAEAMKQAAATDKTQLSAMAAKGRELILRQFTWDDVAQRSAAAVGALRKHFDVAQEAPALVGFRPGIPNAALPPTRNIWSLTCRAIRS